VQIDATGSYAYADVVALWSSPQFKDAHRDVLLNPELIVEVLSDSTKQYDRGAKFLRYRTIASLQEYVLISQEDPVIMRYNRQPDGTWLVNFIHGLNATMDFLSVGCSVPLSEVYRDVEFPSAPAPASTGGA
jgi:Uma2 family endonuclease